MRTIFAVRKDLADMRCTPISATERIGLEEAASHIENWISPRSYHEPADQS